MKFSRIFCFLLLYLEYFNPSILMGASQSASAPLTTTTLEGIESIHFHTNGPGQLDKNGCVSNIESLLKTAIKASKKGEVKVDIFVYSINDWVLVCNPESRQGLLKTLLSQNAHVRIVTDQAQFQEAYSKNTLECLKNGSEFPRNLEIITFPHSTGSMHTKTAIFKIMEKRHLVVGSYNWTSAARYKNIENCIVITDNGTSQVINSAQSQFDSLLSKRPSSSDPSTSRQPHQVTSDSATSTIDSQMSGRGDNPLTESTTPIPTRQRRGVEQRSPPGGPPHPRLQGQQLTSRTTALANFPPQGNSADPSSSHSITRSRSSSPPASSPWSDITSSQQDIINKLP